MATSRTIAVLVQTSVTYGRGIFRGIADYSRTHERWALSTGDPSRQDQMARLLEECDGVIAQVYGTGLEDMLLASGVPVVNVSASLPEPRLPTVVVNNALIGRLAAEHLLELGIQQYAYLAVSAHHSSQLRGEAFAKTVEEAGCPCAWLGVPDKEGRLTADGQQAEELAAQLQALPHPVGLLVFNDPRARIVVEACNRAGLRVPEDVAVVGVDNDDLFCEVSQPPLSSVDVMPDRLGYEAAALMTRLLAGEAPPTQPIMLPPRGVVARQSTDMLAVSDPEIATALRFIRANASTPILVEDVLTQIPIARRALEMRFAKTLGRSPAAEIRRVHVEQARKLLTQTDLPIPDVAKQSGFRYPAHMAQVFRKMTGVTPSAYRKRFRRA